MLWRLLSGAWRCVVFVLCLRSGDGEEAGEKRFSLHARIPAQETFDFVRSAKSQVRGSGCQRTPTAPTPGRRCPVARASCRALTHARTHALYQVDPGRKSRGPDSKSARQKLKRSLQVRAHAQCSQLGKLVVARLTGAASTACHTTVVLLLLLLLRGTLAHCACLCRSCAALCARTYAPCKSAWTAGACSCSCGGDTGSCEADKPNQSRHQLICTRTCSCSCDR